MTRDQLVADLNAAAAAVAEMRAAETPDYDAISDGVVKLDAIRSELAAHDQRETPNIEVAEAPQAPVSFGRSVADLLSGAPIGTTQKLDRYLITDPTGTSLDANVADVTWSDIRPGIATGPEAPIRFLDIVSSNSTSSDSVTWLQETGFTNNAAERLHGEGTAESELSFSKNTAAMVAIAHKLVVAEETLADQQALASIINNRAVSGLRERINGNLLAGSNVGNFNSIRAGATAFTATETDFIDQLVEAKTALAEAGFNPSHIVMSPAQWQAIMTSKTSGGAYLASGPFASTADRLWGLPVIADGAFGGNAMVLDASSFSLWNRSGVDVGTDRDLNTGMVTVRVQVRLQATMERPEGVLAW